MYDEYKKRITIKDVAKAASVSITTVSHAMSGTKYVKPQTIEHIKAISEKMGYKPNSIARGLRKKSLKMIAVYLPVISSQFFSNILIGINEVALKNNYHTILVTTFYDIAEEIKINEDLKDQIIDGAIFISGYDNKEYISKLVETKFPFVLVGRKLGEKYPSVLIDNYQATKNAVDYLIKYNHKDIGYISLDYKNKKTIRDRYQGYVDALKENNIKLNPEYVLMSERLALNEISYSYILCKEFLKLKNPPTAIMAATDNIAVGVYKCLKDNGYKIPEDISVVGFDDLLISNYLDPPLTSVKQPKTSMGSQAMELLLKLIRKDKVNNKHIILKNEIIVRNSVAPLNTNK